MAGGSTGLYDPRMPGFVSEPLVSQALSSSTWMLGRLKSS